MKKFGSLVCLSLCFTNSAYGGPSLSQTFQDAAPLPEPQSMEAKKLKRYENTAPGQNPDAKTNDDPRLVPPEHKNIYDTDASVLPDEQQGWRAKLSARGWDFAALYKAEVYRTVSGGDAIETSNLGNFDLKLALDGTKMLGIPGLSAFVYFLGDHGGKPSVAAGAAYGVSNIEVEERFFKLYEAWLQQTLFDEKLSLLAGIHDLNAEFYVTDSSGLFFNPSFGIGPEIAGAGVNGPSIFPSTAPSFRIKYAPTKAFAWSSAVFNGQAGDVEHPLSSRYHIRKEDGALHIHEAAFSPEADEGASKYAVGYWAFTEEVVTLDADGEKMRNSGYYALINQTFSAALSGFLRYGASNPDINQVASCGSAGVVWKGLLASRPEDALGLGAIRLGKSAKMSGHGPDTTVTELTYKIALREGLSFQPNVQYFDYPGNSNTPRSALTIGARLEIGF